MTDAIRALREQVEAGKRVRAFLDEWEMRRRNGSNSDPERIYTLGMHDDGLNLTVSDLRAILRALEAQGGEA